MYERESGSWERRALLANMRQELLAPAGAILGYAEMVVDQAGGMDCPEAVDDLERILSSARDLSDLSARLLDPEHATELLDGEDDAATQSRIRHDLRTPLNAIKGYSELLIEEAEEIGVGPLVDDLGGLLEEANRLLDGLESIIDFSRSSTEPSFATDGGDGADMADSLAASIRPGSAVGEARVEPGRVLVVDDNESNRRLLARWIAKGGHEVATAENGEQGLAMLVDGAFDVVLLDLMMPGINGFEVLQRLKTDPATAELPVIMISAVKEMDSIVRCIEAGADDYLPKPVNTTLLTARLNTSLERKQAHDRERLYLARIEEEKQKSENLLLNILPAPVVERMHGGETMIADRFDAVTVLFADIVDFTRLSEGREPHDLVVGLNRLFSEFDALTRKLGVEKIKTIGDAYMVCTGLPEPSGDHAEAACEMALGMQRALERVNAGGSERLEMRIGLHSGSVTAGVIGTHKFVYDVWGDAVNTASRMESHAEPGRIQVSAETARLVDGRYRLAPRGTIRVKGKGDMKTFVLEGRY